MQFTPDKPVLSLIFACAAAASLRPLCCHGVLRGGWIVTASRKLSSVILDSFNTCDRRTRLSRIQSEEAATLSEDTPPFARKNSLGSSALGCLAGNGSGILNLEIGGGAILPLIQAAIAEHIGIHHAFFVPVICYLYILRYALEGSKPNSECYG